MSDLENRLAELGTRFAARAPDEAQAIEGALAEGDLATLIDRSHKLAGIAAMFGHPEVGDAALRLETAALAGSEWRAAADELVRQLRTLA